MAMLADRRLYLTRDRSRVVEEGDVEAAFLLASEGRDIEVSEIHRLGLKLKDGRVVVPGAEPEPTPEPEPEPEVRQESKPEEKPEPKPAAKPRRGRR